MFRKSFFHRLLKLKSILTEQNKKLLKNPNFEKALILLYIHIMKKIYTLLINGRKSSILDGNKRHCNRARRNW